MAKVYNTVIFDLGDVLFTWSATGPTSPLPAKVLRNILRSHHWFEYEKGNLSEEEIYTLVGQEFNVSPDDVEAALEAARHSLKGNPQMIATIQKLRGAGLTIYAMSNISAPDWKVLSSKATTDEWDLFSHVFTSAAAHERKPNLGFYKHVIEGTGINPCRTIFVDDKLENVLTARSFGMHGILFDDQLEVIKELNNLCYDPITRGRNFLASYKKKLLSVTSNGTELSENFSQLLILDATGDESLVDYVKHPGQFNFFQGGSVLTNELFPDDLDTTAIALTLSHHIDTNTKHKVMDEMLKYKNSDGIVQVYFDRSRPRIDPIVCVNVLTLFYQNGRGHQLSATLEWIKQILIHRAYVSGTLYYVGADLFLFFLSRLLRTSSEVRESLGPIFKERIVERLRLEGDSLSLAARIIAATVVNLIDDHDLEKLLSRQCEDGAWKDGWFYRSPSVGILIKNDGATTAYAMRAIQQVQGLREARFSFPKEYPAPSSFTPALFRLATALKGYCSSWYHSVV